MFNWLDKYPRQAVYLRQNMNFFIIRFFVSELRKSPSFRERKNMKKGRKE